jgi:hypothetical protein
MQSFLLLQKGNFANLLPMKTYLVETTPFVKTRANHGKKII